MSDSEEEYLGASEILMPDSGDLMSPDLVIPARDGEGSGDHSGSMDNQCVMPDSDYEGTNIISSGHVRDTAGADATLMPDSEDDGEPVSCFAEIENMSGSRFFIPQVSSSIIVNSDTKIELNFGRIFGNIGDFAIQIYVLRVFCRQINNLACGQG